MGSPAWMVHPSPFLIFEHKLGLLETCPSGTFPLLAAWRRRMSTTRDVLVHNIFEKADSCLPLGKRSCRVQVHLSYIFRLFYAHTFWYPSKTQVKLFTCFDSIFHKLLYFSHTVTRGMKAGIAGLEKTSTNRQRHWKNVSAVLNNRLTPGIVGSRAFYAVRIEAV